MRILILSDIHANWVALEAVLDAAGEVDAAWCLGDVVGYGPSPNECVARLRELPNLICLLGNHDAAAIGDLPLDSFNPEARLSVEWQRESISDETRAFLQERPGRAEWEEFTLVHASPRQPMLEYLLDAHAALENFAHFDGPYCFVGHTHIPIVFKLNSGGDKVDVRSVAANTSYKLDPREIINPGSVGQPRDRDPRAAFAILDSEEGTWDYRRVNYDIAAVQRRMEAANLPERHILRLEAGW